MYIYIMLAASAIGHIIAACELDQAVKLFRNVIGGLLGINVYITLYV